MTPSWTGAVIMTHHQNLPKTNPRKTGGHASFHFPPPQFLPPLYSKNKCSAFIYIHQYYVVMNILNLFCNHLLHWLLCLNVFFLLILMLLAQRTCILNINTGERILTAANSFILYYTCDILILFLGGDKWVI